MKASDLLAASPAKSQLASMMNSGNLQAIFGKEIAGISTESVLAIMQSPGLGLRSNFVIISLK